MADKSIADLIRFEDLVTYENFKHYYQHFSLDTNQAINISVMLKMGSFALLFSEDSSHEEESKIEEISGVAYSGFIPFQDGGYEVSSLYAPWGSGMYKSSDEEKSFVELENDFYTENNIPEDADLTDEQQEELTQYMFEYGYTLYRLEIWCKKADDPQIFKANLNDQVYIRLSIGYKDVPYYRSSFDETLSEITIESFEEFLKKTNEELLKELLSYKYK